MRVFPKIYSYNSVWALFPFSTPEVTRETLTRLKLTDKYDFTSPIRVPKWHMVESYDGCSRVLGECGIISRHRMMRLICLLHTADKQTYTPVYGAQAPEATFDASSPFSLFDIWHSIAQAKPQRHLSTKQVLANALFPIGWEKALHTFCVSETAKAIREFSWTYDHNKTVHLDVVRDIAIVSLQDSG